MFSIILTWLIVAWSALCCIYMLSCAWRRFPKRDVDDVIPFLYPVDISLAESLLDPAAEFEFRWKLSPPQFRDAQRKRMRLYLELTRRMAHNATVLVQYADAEKNSHDPRRVSLASALQQKAIEVRLYSLLTRIKLRFCLLLRSEMLASSPALAHCRKAACMRWRWRQESWLKATRPARRRLPPRQRRENRQSGDVMYFVPSHQPQQPEPLPVCGLHGIVLAGKIRSSIVGAGITDVNRRKYPPLCRAQQVAGTL